MAIYSFGERVNSSKDGKNTCYDEDGKKVNSPTCDDVSTSSAGKLGLGLRYANGPLYLAAAYHVRKDDESRINGTAKSWDDDSAGAKGWGIGGSYDFKVVKVFANYFRGKVNHNAEVDGTAVDGSNKQTTWSLGVGVPVSSAGTVIAEYAQYKDYQDFVKIADGKSPGHKAKGYSLGYKHTLSKRTILHTYVTRIDNDRTINGNAGWKKTGVLGEDQTIFSAGIVHLF
jgi:predicted porin